MKFRMHGTLTPYSDALKAAAVSPHRHSLLCGESVMDPLANLRNDFRRSYVGTSPLLPPYWLPSLPPPPPPSPYKGMSPPLPVTTNPSRNLLYPIVYKPKIITPQIARADEEIDVTQ